MDDLEKIVRINNLYDLYKDLLTEKQRTYIEEYYFDNMSLAEISENHNISRNGVYSQLNLAIDELEKYENTLHLLEKNKKREEIVEKIKDAKGDINALLDELMEV